MYALTPRQASVEYLEHLENRLKELSSRVGALPTDQLQPVASGSSAFPFVPPMPTRLSPSRSEQGSLTNARPIPTAETLSPEAPNLARGGVHTSSIAGSLAQSSSISVSAAPGRSELGPRSTELPRRQSPDIRKLKQSRLKCDNVLTLHSANSSARTLLDCVDAAAERFFGQKGSTESQDENESTALPMASRYQPAAEAPVPVPALQDSHEAYDLPNRFKADKLVRRYYEQVHAGKLASDLVNSLQRCDLLSYSHSLLTLPCTIVYCIIHWPTFLTNYRASFDGSKVLSKDWLALLNAVFAIGCLVGAPDETLASASNDGLRFYQRSATFMHTLVHTSSSIETMQCLLLMAQYLQSISQPRMCWNATGQAVRLALAQGFHLPSQNPRRSAIEAETRRRVWAGVVILEAKVSAALGFPPSLTVSECSQVRPAPLPDDNGTEAANRTDVTSIETFIASFELYIRQIALLQSMYTSSTISTSAWPDVSAIVMNDRALQKWEEALPVYLRHNETQHDPIDERTELLRIRLLNARMLLYRPMLFHLCQRPKDVDLFGAAPSPLDRKIALAGAQECVQSAIELVERTTGENGRGTTGAWCELVSSHGYMAALTRLHPSYRVPNVLRQFR